MNSEKRYQKPYTIRSANKNDNNALLNLAKNCPMKDGFEFFIDRSPDFFKLYEIQSNDYHILVYEKDGDIVAAIGSMVLDVYINGIEESVVLIGDLYILPQHRKGRILARLMSEIVKVNSAKYTLGMSSYQEDNYDSIETSKGRMGFPAGELLSEQRLLSLIPVFKKRIDEDIIIEKAKESDLNEMVNVYNEYYSSYDFAPRYSKKTFMNLIDRVPDLKLSDFWLAKKDNKIVSVTALWDGKSVQNMVISKMGFFYKILAFLISFFSLIPGYSKKQFKVGYPVEFLWICFNAYKIGEERSFKNLLSHINNETRKSKYLLSFLTIDSNDGLNDLLNGYLKTEIKHKVFFFSIRENAEAKDFINKKRCKFFDYTLGI